MQLTPEQVKGRIKNVAKENKAEKYDRMQAQLRLMCELAEGRRSGEEEGWISSEDVRNHFRTRANAK